MLTREGGHKVKVGAGHCKKISGALRRTESVLHFQHRSGAEALAPNTLVQCLSLPHHSTSLHNNISTCLRFVHFQ